MKILILIIIQIILSFKGKRVAGQWLQPYYDTYHTSYAWLTDPVINQLTWTYNDQLLYNQTNINTSPFTFNPIVLEDQSFIILSSSNTMNRNKNSQLIITRLNYNSTIYYYNITGSISINQDNNHYSLLGLPLYQSLIIYDLLNSNLYSFNLNNGSEIWSNENGTIQDCGYPQFINNYVTLNCKDIVYYIDVDNGHIVEQIEFPFPSTIERKSSLYSLLEGIDSNRSLVYIDYNDYGSILIYNSTSLQFQPIPKLQFSSDYRLVSNGDDVQGNVATTTAALTQLSNGQVSESLYLVTCYQQQTMALEIRDVVTGVQLYYIELVHQVACQAILNTRIQLSSPIIFISFIIDEVTYNSTYLATIDPTQYVSSPLKWLIFNESLTILDQSLVSTNNYIYLCTKEYGLMLTSSTGKKTRKLGWPTITNSSDDEIIDCKMSIGENSVVLMTQSQSMERNILRVGDSICTQQCGLNWTCTTTNCQCDPTHFPTGVCNLYCDADTTCSGHGSCDQQGQCVCMSGTGYYGDACENCKKGYFGDQCNMHFSWMIIGIALGLATLVTSGICIFACLTRPKHKKSCFSSCLAPFRRLFQWLQKKSSTVTENQSLIQNTEL